MKRTASVSGATPWLVSLGCALAVACSSQGVDFETSSGSTTRHDLSEVAPRYRESVGWIADLTMREIENKQIPAISIALVSGQETIWAAGFGESDPETGGVATSSTVYRVGSVSKLFTDLAVMRLVEDSQLDLDAPVTDYLPDFLPGNAYGQPITLRQLMAHRSGLVREPPVGNYFETSEPSLSATVESLNQTQLVYAPESRTKYSNAAIAVVGYVLEHTQQQPFAEYLRKNVLDPLGMEETGFELTASLSGELAKARMWGYDGREFEAPGFQLGMAPAGSMYSTVNDLAIFIKAMLARGEGANGRILDSETLDLMWTPQFATANVDQTSTGFGLGFAVDELSGERRIRHGGAIYGFSTELAFLPEAQLGVVVISSMDFTNSVVSRIASASLESLLAEQSGHGTERVAPTTPLSSDEARSLSGLYRGDEGYVRIRARGSRAFLERGALTTELRKGEAGFIVDSRLAYGTEVRIEDDELTISGNAYRRIEDPIPDPCPEPLRDYIGEYGWDHNTLFILEERGTLYALIEWFERYPLTEKAVDRFAFPDRGGLYHGEDVVFERSPGGAVTAAIAGGIRFERRKVGAEQGETFRITPLQPIESLRASALQATPPAEDLDALRKPDLVEPSKMDPSILLDIRYATTNNFMSAEFYVEPRAFLQRPAAQAVVRAHENLKEQGYGLLLHDAYRPWYVTKMFYDATPEEQKIFVADPSSGSRHNRGAAVDLTLYDLETRLPVRTTGGYDEFSERSFPDYPGGTSRQRWLRELLRDAMEAEGFEVYEFEWWHFDYQDWQQYPILNETFENLEASR